MFKNLKLEWLWIRKRYISTIFNIWVRSKITSENRGKGRGEGALLLVTAHVKGIGKGHNREEGLFWNPENLDVIFEQHSSNECYIQFPKIHSKCCLTRKLIWLKTCLKFEQVTHSWLSPWNILFLQSLLRNLRNKSSLVHSNPKGQGHPHW